MPNIVPDPGVSDKNPRREINGYGDLLAVLDALPIICRETRRRKSQSLREAATEVGCSFSTISRLETRTGDPNLASVVAIPRWAAS